MTLPKLNEGDGCFVFWGPERLALLVKVLKSRPLKSKAGKHDATVTATTSETRDTYAHEYEYYVHYVHYPDCRLDAWITLEAFNLRTLHRAAPSPRRRGASPNDLVTQRQPDKDVCKVIIGTEELPVWYYCPLPGIFASKPILYVCEFCLHFSASAHTYREHRATCQHQHPPGHCIFQKEDLKVYEVEAAEDRQFSQRLCLAAKFFLNDKSSLYDSNHTFYILTKTKGDGEQVVGFFSKDKQSPQGYNVACLLVFPHFASLGYGSFLIDLSYQLTMREGKTGSPETPLSDAGRTAYEKYWQRTTLQMLTDLDLDQPLSIDMMTQRTGIREQDLVDTLQSLGLLRQTANGLTLALNSKLVSSIRSHLENQNPTRICDPRFLHWQQDTLGSRETVTSTEAEHSSSESSYGKEQDASRGVLRSKRSPRKGHCDQGKAKPMKRSSRLKTRLVTPTKTPVRT